MDEQNVKNEKKKELLNIYWFLLMVMAAVSLVNLLAISTDSMKAAAIVNVVLLFAIPLTFVLGYIDFRNFAPMSVKKEFAYDATAVIALFISLIHFNVRNYTFMQDYTDENTYIIWVSMFAALYLAIAFICLLLTFLNFHSRKKQTKYYYATAIASIVSCVFLTAFNYNTTVTIFWAPLKLMGLQDGFVVDLGITVLALRVIVEYGIFIFHAVREKQKGGLPEGEETEYKKCVFIPSVIAVVFMLVNVIVLPIISGMQNFYPDKKQGLFIGVRNCRKPFRRRPACVGHRNLLLQKKERKVRRNLFKARTCKHNLFARLRDYGLYPRGHAYRRKHYKGANRVRRFPFVDKNRRACHLHLIRRPA